MAFRTFRPLGAVQRQAGQPTPQAVAQLKRDATLIRPGERVQQPPVINYAKEAMRRPSPYDVFASNDLNPRPTLAEQQRILYDAMHAPRPARSQALHGPSLAQSIRNIWRR
jgi:hypothetical protein